MFSAPTTTPSGGGHSSANVALRKELDLFANVRPVKNVPGVEGRFKNVNFTIVRENTEGLYSGLEHEVVPGVVESLKIMTEKASTRIAVLICASPPLSVIRPGQDFLSD